jgi:cell division protein FtsI/penicillin-binding protein 2
MGRSLVAGSEKHSLRLEKGPWRLEVRTTVASLLVLALLGLLSWLCLSQTSKVSTTEYRIWERKMEIARLQRENAESLAEVVEMLSVSRLESRALELGYIFAEERRYLDVPGCPCCLRTTQGRVFRCRAVVGEAGFSIRDLGGDATLMIVKGRTASKNDDESSGSKERAFRRLAFLVAVLTGLVLVITVRLVYLQIIQGVFGDSRSSFPPGYTPETTPHRGLIIDRGGRVLVLNIFEYEITAAPKEIRKMEDPQEVANDLSPLLDLSPDELVSVLDSDKPYALLKKRVSKEVGDAIASFNFTGVYLEPKLRRKYPERELAAHLLGFVNLDSEGGYGVEGYHDLLLKGGSNVLDGREYHRGEAVPFVFPQLPLPKDGTHLVLTLDRNIQYLVEGELAKAVAEYQADGGTIIVMNPKTGAILAMANYPSYDPNRFFEVPMELYVNPAVSGQYEPGSVFKVITMAAGLDAGIITPDSTFYDSGAIRVGGATIQNPDRRAHGLVSMTDILAYSLNVGIAYVSTSLGEETFYAYLKRFGCGDYTGIDLEGEVAGTVREPGSEEWYESDLGTNSFGQGIALTPLQMITAVAAVANRGLLMKPHVVERVVHEQGVIITQPTIWRQVVSAQTAEQLTHMLVKAVERGTELAIVPGYDIAGKTGTAQIPVDNGYDPELTIASFVGYAPADDPQFIVLVKIDKPRLDPWGAEVAAPVFKAIAERLFVLLDIPPDGVRLASR